MKLFERADKITSEFHVKRWL